MLVVTAGAGVKGPGSRISGQGYSAKPEATAGIAGEDEEDSWSTDTLVKYGGWAAAAIVMVSAMMARPS